MWREILRQAWEAMRRHRLRSTLTMLGVVWGIMAVTLLIAYGDGFHYALVRGFDAFGKNAVVCWPRQTSQQAGGQRAGKPVRFELEDVNWIQERCSLVRHVSPESVRWLPITYQGRLRNTAVRAVWPVYGEIRNEVPSEGRWLSQEDLQERRRVVFLGSWLRKKLFGGRPAVGETVQIAGVRFQVIGTMDIKLQLSSYFTSDDESAWIPLTTAGDLWNTRYLNVIVFEPVAPSLEAKAKKQVLATVAERQRFSATDERATWMLGREEFRPIVEGITIGLRILVTFIGILTLGIGGVGVMNIMLVSVNERTREIGLRRAVGARRQDIRQQFLWEALLLTLAGGAIGIVLAFVLAGMIESLPFLGPIFEDESGKGDIHLKISFFTVALSTAILVLVGVLSGLFPALRAAKLDPVEALRYE